MRRALFAIAFLVLAVAATERGEPHHDVATGRATFIAAGCSECHRVSADPELPASMPHGPMLCGLSTRPASEISALIVARSPSGSKWLQASESGMAKSTSCTTLQDVRGIAVYLQARAQ